MPFTSKEIEELKEDNRSLVGWVKELCWQVAKLREENTTVSECIEESFSGGTFVPKEEPRQKRKYTRRATA